LQNKSIGPLQGPNVPLIFSTGDLFKTLNAAQLEYCRSECSVTSLVVLKIECLLDPLAYALGQADCLALSRPRAR
jgi:hypothetical protein